MNKKWEELLKDSDPHEMYKLARAGLIIVAALGLVLGLLSGGARGGLSLIAASISLFGIGILSKLK